MAKEELGPSEKKELKMLDADSLIDEIISKKGPHKYTGGLSESNWEQVLAQTPIASYHRKLDIPTSHLFKQEALVISVSALYSGNRTNTSFHDQISRGG